MMTDRAAVAFVQLRNSGRGGCAKNREKRKKNGRDRERGKRTDGMNPRDSNRIARSSKEILKPYTRKSGFYTIDTTH